MERRNFIRIAGSAAVIFGVTAGGFGIWAKTRTPTRALLPWNEAGKGYTDVRMWALSYAILAPNPHNLQPWMVDLSDQNSILLLCDPTRLLPETDPFGRQIVIGLGCFLELLCIAIREKGMTPEIELFPEGEPTRLSEGLPIARIKLNDAAFSKPDPLFDSVLERRSNKEPFDVTRIPSSEVCAKLESVSSAPVKVFTTTDQRLVNPLRTLTANAMELELRTPAKLQESINVMRFGKNQIEASPDGIDMGGAFLEGLHVLGILNSKVVADPSSTAFMQTVDLYNQIMNSATGYVWLISSGNSRADQIEAGRTWMRVALTATASEVDVHPISQALQEYAEMDSIREELKNLLVVSDSECLQMLARLGHGPKVPPSPRWVIETRVV